MVIKLAPVVTDHDVKIIQGRTVIPVLKNHVMLRMTNVF